MSGIPRAMLATVLLAACGPGDTGGQLVAFHAYASGIPEATGALDFETGAGFRVHLTQASLHIGAVYFRLGQVNPGSAEAACVGETTYGLQVPGAVDVDVLSNAPQAFSVLGSATTDRNQSAEIWLVDGDINQVASATPIVTVAGSAARGAERYAFRGTITIGQNRLVPPSNVAKPGANPICKQRIVAPIPVDLRPAAGGVLVLRIDPRPWFGGVDFSTLLPGEDGKVVQIPDSSSGSGPDILSGRNFFAGVTGASADVYQFSWVVLH